VFVAYSPPAGTYTVKVPRGGPIGDRRRATFTDKYNSVRLELTDAAVAPTEASARNEIPALQSASPSSRSARSAP